LRQVTGDDIQPAPPVEAKAADTAKKTEQGNAAKDADEKTSKSQDDALAEMSFFEKLALKAAKLTGTVPVEAVFQEKVCPSCGLI
jgi:hypothetical protein